MILSKRSLSLALLTISLNIYCFYQSDYIPYQGISKKITTKHFVVIFPEKFSAKAKIIASYAEDIHKNLVDYINWQPHGKTIIILSDQTDFPNGSALPIFRNVITLYLVSTDLEPTLRIYDDPLYSLILHEYTHILHLDQIRGGAWFWRIIYGKLYHPLLNTFRWYMEGVAVLSETQNASGGRLDSNYTDAMIRTAAREHKIPSYNKLILPVVDWPHGDGLYLYGARFMEYIYEKYGSEKFRLFIKDISDDFWPFVTLFVSKFKKIYGESLYDLWNDWKAYEESEAQKINPPKLEANKITTLNGEILSIARGKDCFYISSYSYKKDSYLYKLTDDKKLIKLHYGYHRSISTTNDDNKILYTAPSSYPDGSYYFDLYSLNLKTKISKKLTNRKRISYISFAKNSPHGLMVSYNGNGVILYKAKFYKGRINEIEKIDIPEDIAFIDTPSIDKDGNKAVFSARTNNRNFKIYTLDLSTNKLNVIKNIYGQKAKWIDDNNISFICNDGFTDSLFYYSITDNNIFKVTDTYGCITDGIITDNKTYYVDYTAEGQELFWINTIKMQTKLPEISDSEIKTLTRQTDFNQNWKTGYYSGFEYSYPSIWGFLPYRLSSDAYFLIPMSTIITLPFIGPQFFIYNTSPLGRFTYYATVACDYLKLYPDNAFGFSAKLPFINIDYSWNNFAGGYKHYYINRFYELKHDGKFPINFNNYLSLNGEYPFGNGTGFYWNLSSAHYFQEYNFDIEKHYSNEFTFMEQIGFYFLQPRVRASRWDRGFYIDILAYQKPHGILDNSPLYILKGEIEGRIPAGNAFYYINIHGGTEFLNQNIFTCYTESFRFSESFVNGTGYNYISKIDMKAFSLNYIYDYNELRSGSNFIGVDTGFDISFIKKSLYWHFASMGFKELYLRVYGELIYIYNSLYSVFQEYGILFDIANELTVNLFVDYGEINFSMTLGTSVGYAVGNTKPNYNIYFYFNAGL
jgi:hypothetical protein